jgi:hypothetical protein
MKNKTVTGEQAKIYENQKANLKKSTLRKATFQKLKEKK